MNRVKLLTISLFLLCAIQGLSAQNADRASLVSPGAKEAADEILYKGSYALIVGACNYQNKNWKGLPGVKADVDAVEIALKAQGFETTKVLDPTLAELERAYKGFISKYGSNKDNRLIFYFAGHGHTIMKSIGAMGYIVPVDAPGVDSSEFELGAMPITQFDTYAGLINSKHALFVFDSCFAGTIFVQVAPQRGAAPSVISDKTGNPVLEFLTSGSAEETVPDKSIFREQFLLGISGAADADGDGYVTCDELWTYLQSQVVNLSSQAGHPQQPQFGKIFGKGSHVGDFVFILPGVRRVSKKEPDKVVAAAYRMSDSLLQAQNLQLGFTGQIDENRARQLFMDASTKGDPLATMWIARNMFIGGCGFPKNEADAQKIAKTVIGDVRALADSNVADAVFLYGDALLNGLGIDKDYTQAVISLRKAAANGYAMAILMLGYIYSEGVGLPKDALQAVSYYRLASEKGLAVATVNLGTMYRDGKGVPQDYARALDLFKSAAEKGKFSGMYALAAMYRDGLGIPKNASQAIYWYSKAAEGGDTSSMLELARLYKQTPAPADPQRAKSAVGTPTVKYQTDQAISWYGKAVEGGDNEALGELVNLYLGDTEGFKDTSQLLPLFRKVVARGDSVGLAYLGWAYDNGNGVAADQIKASYYYKQAAEQGNIYAMMRLGEFCIEGKVVPQDFAQAEKYFRQSESAYAQAAVDLGLMYAKGQGVPRNPQEAIGWYSKVAYPTGPTFDKQTGFRNAQIELARLYESSPAPIKDDVKAYQWYRRAACLGSSEAMEKLAAMYDAGIGVGKDPHLAEMWRKNAKKDNAKRFTVPCDTVSGKQLFYIFIVENYPPNEDNPLKDEVARLLADHSAKVPSEVVDSFKKLLKIARDNNVSFCDLCVYALGTASNDAPADTKKPKTKKPRDFDFANEDAIRKALDGKNE